MHKRFLILCAGLAMAACAPTPPPPESAYYNRGGPDQLLDTSAEVVNLSIAGSAQRTELSKWIGKDRPSRAELYCKTGDTHCTEAKKLLELHRVPTMMVASADNSVALVYERVVARDCDQRYRDHTHDWHWANPQEYGCSVAANIVQHVSDKQQFVNPAMMDNPRATGPANTYTNAYKTQASQQQQQQSTGLDQSTLSQVSTTAGGN